MYYVITTVLSVVFIQSLQGCNQIELERRTHLRSHQDKSLSGLLGAWALNQSVILFTMLNIHIVYHFLQTALPCWYLSLSYFTLLFCCASTIDESIYGN